MISEPENESRALDSPFTAKVVEEILRERGWFRGESAACTAWMAEAAMLLGRRAVDRESLAGLLTLVFEYDARVVAASRECQEILTREGARDVLRVLALEILGGGSVDSNRLKEIVTMLRSTLSCSSRAVLHPLRVSLAGRIGGGELDRVVLLLDPAAVTEGLAPVKSVRVRILEFCAAME